MKKHKNLISQYIGLVKNEFHGYSGKSLISDIIAGITVGAVALPLALAFGAASVGEADPKIGIVAGMITAIIAGIICGILGGGSFQISGPTGAMTAILGSVVANHGISGMFAASFVAGVILLLAGILHFGKIVKFIPKPVVTGFTSGIAVVIALGQLGNFFGVKLSGETAVDKVIYFFTDTLNDISLTAIICSAAVILMMLVYPKKLAKFVPGSLAAIIAITIITAIFRIDVETIGSIPSTLINSEKLAFSDINIDLIGKILSPAVTIALLGMVESLLCGACAANMKKEKFDSNIELVAQGAGNIIIPFLGGVPATAAIARTSVAVKSGGKTRLASLFHSVFLIACMFILSGAIGLVPYAALAGVLIVTAVRMNEFDEIRHYFKEKNLGAIAQFIITMVATVLLDLTYAIIIGVALAFIILAFNILSLKKEGKKADKLSIKKTNENGIASIKLDGVLYFAKSDVISSEIEELGEYHELCIDLENVVYIDYTANEAISELVKNLRSSGKEVSVRLPA